MNLYITRVADMFERVDRYLVERAIIPAIARIAAAHASILTILTALRAAGQNQSSGLGEFTGGVDTRESLRTDLRDLLRYVNRTGRLLDKQYPGIAGTFRLPRGASDLQLLAAAMAIEAKATELETDFVACGLPASFLTEMADLIDAFRDATALKHDGRILRAGSTADLKAKASAGIAAAKELDTCVRNHFRGNAEALAAWAAARHIQRGPRRTEETVSLAANPPSSGAISGTNNTVIG
jgi:hypothetical protein